jgi:hypothetical protein
MGIRIIESRRATKPINKMGFDNNRHPKAPTNNQAPRPKCTGQLFESNVGVAA